LRRYFDLGTPETNEETVLNETLEIGFEPLFLSRLDAIHGIGARVFNKNGKIVFFQRFFCSEGDNGVVFYQQNRFCGCSNRYGG